MSEAHNTLRRMVYKLRLDAAEAKEHAAALEGHADTLEETSLTADDEHALLFVAIMLAEVPELRECAVADKDQN